MNGNVNEWRVLHLKITVKRILLTLIILSIGCIKPVDVRALNGQTGMAPRLHQNSFKLSTNYTQFGPAYFSTRFR